MKNEIPPCFREMEQDRPPTKRYANFRILEVRHSIFGDKTPKNPSGLLFEGYSTVGTCGKAIAKLIIDYGWRLDDAAILFSVLCEGCMNTLGSQLEGYKYNENPNTCCDHCDVIRPGIIRPLTTKEEKNQINSILIEAGAKVYASYFSNQITILPKKRKISKEEITGIYRVTENE
jgi:hypothetical protein